MNQKIRQLGLRSLMTSPDGWGSLAGQQARRALSVKLGTVRGAGLLRLSLAGVPRIDVTFAAEVIVAVVEELRGRVGLCLTDPVNDDVVANIAAAATLAGAPVWLWRGDHPQVLGPKPAGGLGEALARAIARPQVRAGDLAGEIGISVTNASTRLKKLWEAGYLLREEIASPSGGTEFAYARIG